VKFDDYEKKHFRLYSDFATTVANILARSIESASLPAPQSIQARAKDPDRLKARLVQEGGPGLDCEIEKERRDLAGARIIFYTNNDVEDFKRSGLVFDNFEVEREATKLHYPTKENKGARYNALHFTVSLKPDRAALPEYAKFAGLRCEIQVHTILNHAWSETSHDILYKLATSPGFGKKEMERLERRMNAVMDRHLMQAGYQIQRVQRDYRRLQDGKELFDTDAIQTLLNATDNNERFDLLTTLKDETLANYDDIQGIYGELREPLIQVARKARQTDTKPIDTAFGELNGHRGRDVVKLIVDTRAGA
jgi:ppGpp synthetase/RelA/SpoT-type nucleotidyltranferase